MAKESKFEELMSKVHGGVPLEVPAKKAVSTNQNVTVTKTEQVQAGSTPATAEPEAEIEQPVKVQQSAIDPVTIYVEQPIKLTEKRKRKPQADYQSLFFNRIDFTHRKPLYITATTHRRLMRIVHLMDESKATISSYVENIILNHLDTFKEDIDTIYQTNNINPTE